MTTWQVLVDRDDHRHTEVFEAAPPELADGEVRLPAQRDGIDVIGLTSAGNVDWST